MPAVADRLLPPPIPIQQQHQEPHRRPTLPPLVSRLLLIPQLAVDPLHMVVRPHPTARRALQEGDHLGELLRRQGLDRLAKSGTARNDRSDTNAP